MNKYQVSIQLTVVMSKQIKAESMEDALKIAEKLAAAEEGARAAVGWEYQWCEKAQVQGVSQ